MELLSSSPHPNREAKAAVPTSSIRQCGDDPAGDTTKKTNNKTFSSFLWNNTFIYNQTANPFYHSSLLQHRIPHILIFTYRTNLVFQQSNYDGNGPRSSGKAPHKLSKQEELFLQNVHNTIRVYVSAWQEQVEQKQQKQKQQPNNNNNDIIPTTTPVPRVWFLDNGECQRVIALVEPRLLPFFQRESIGKYQADVCRAAALYLSGGYYFDVDMKALQAFVPQPTTTFSSAVATPDPHITTTTTARAFFNSFQVAAPRHVIVYVSLQIMLQSYQERRQRLLNKGVVVRKIFKRVYSDDEDEDQSHPHQQHNYTREDKDRIRHVMNAVQNDLRVWNQTFTQRVQNDTAFQNASQRALDDGIFHKNQEWRDGANIGTFALQAACEYYQQKESEWQLQEQQEQDGGSGATTRTRTRQTTTTTTVELLYEDNFESVSDRMKWYPNLVFQDNPGGGCCCNHLVHSRSERQAYFFSRMIGAGGSCPMPLLSLLPPSSTANSTTTTTNQSSNTGAINSNHDSHVEYFSLPYYDE
ncbi:hypothetical protein ACA910_004261 [Epithemia clementina (nom. ined.)]